jgi:tetratricopeptide (TPR) repeat protein
MALAVGGAYIGVLIFNLSRAARLARMAARSNAEPSGSSATAGLSDSEKERALRTEQLQAAETLVKEFPTNDDAVYLEGLVHDEQGDSVTAMKFWERSLELDPTRADANDSLGHALLLRDEYENAEVYFRKALATDPKLATANFRLATALVHQGKFREATAILEKANSLSAEGHRLLGEAYQHLKQFGQAKASYETAIRLKPDLTEAYYGLSKVCAQLGEHDRRDAYFEKFSALKKENEEQARRLRANYDTLAITRKSVAQTHTDVGRVYMIQRRAGAAEELWLKAAALDPENALCRLQLAVLYQQTEKHRDAFRLYEEVAKLDPGDALTHLNLGRVSLKLNQIERAGQAFKEVMRLAPTRPEGYSALAELYLQTNRNVAEALRLADMAVNLAPEARYLAILSQARAQNGDRRGALAAIDRALELQPANGQYLQLRELLLGKK